MAVEVVVGIIASSLALISDAGHMLTDAAAIALALIAARLATRPAPRQSHLRTQTGGNPLRTGERNHPWLLAAWFVYEAIRRLIHPPEVAGGLVLATALVGILINLLPSWLIARADRTSLNVEGAFQHILNDLFAFIATAIAGLIILLTGWARADAIAALIVAALMAKAGWGLIRDSWRIFLEAAPRGINVAAIDADLHAVDGVQDVHDLHVWEVTSGFPALSAHILVDRSHDCHERQHAITDLLQQRYGIDHTTLQVDHRSATIVPTEDLARRLHRTASPVKPHDHDH